MGKRQERSQEKEGSNEGQGQMGKEDEGQDPSLSQSLPWLRRA